MAADPNTASAIDEVFNFDLTDDYDPFNDMTISKSRRDDKPNLSPRGIKRKVGDHDKENSGLGLDEEVQIKKKRRPIAKLDEQRLLSKNGIPKLRALVQSSSLAKKLRVEGKGHEFSDTAKLLNYFQLWLDNLYPRAKFADGLQLIEKAGHSKRMNTMRRAWIDEGKPEYLRDPGLKRMLDGKQDDDPDDIFGPLGGPNADGSAEAQEGAQGDNDQALFGPDTRAAHGEDATDDFPPEGDELDVLLASARETNTRAAESEGEDDLDALLAEHAAKRDATSQQNRDDDDLDDLDALLAEQESGQEAAPVTKSKHHGPFEDDDDDDEDALDALLSEPRIQEEPELPSPSRLTRDTSVGAHEEDSQENMPSSPIPDIDVDDLDALVEEQEGRNREKQTLIFDDAVEIAEDNMLSSSPMPN